MLMRGSRKKSAILEVIAVYQRLMRRWLLADRFFAILNSMFLINFLLFRYWRCTLHRINHDFAQQGMLLLLLLSLLRRSPFEEFPKVLTLLLIKQPGYTLHDLHLPPVWRLLMSEISQQHIRLLSLRCWEHLLWVFHEILLVEDCLGLVVSDWVSGLCHGREIYTWVVLVLIEGLYWMVVERSAMVVIFRVSKGGELGVRVLKGFLLGGVGSAWSLTRATVLRFVLDHYMATAWEYSLGFFCWLSIDSLIIAPSKLHYLLLAIDTLHKQLLLLTHYFHSFILYCSRSLTRFFCCCSILERRLFLFIRRKCLLLLLTHNETTIKFMLLLFTDIVHDISVAVHIIILFNRLKIRHPASSIHSCHSGFPRDLFVWVDDPRYQQTWVSLCG